MVYLIFLFLVLDGYIVSVSPDSWTEHLTPLLAEADNLHRRKRGTWLARKPPKQKGA